MDTKSSMLADVQNIRQLLTSKNVHVCVVGIGRIGLPTALSFANYGLDTIGVDINDKLIEMINTEKYPLKDEPGFDTIFDNVIKNKKLKATKDIQQALSNSNLVILSLPTPMNSKNIPDYSALLTVANSLNNFIKSGTIVVVESTVEPGFVENELTPIIEGDGSRIKCGIDFSVAACPETANPGEILSDFKKLPRVIGAIDEHTTEIVSEIYKHVFNVEILKMSNCRTANAVKLTTNVFRDVNIAFINELAILFEKLDIDIMTVLQAASKKYNFQVHYPGAGVGGPCLPVNSYQMLNSAKKLNDSVKLKIIENARQINESMPEHAIELLSDALNEIGKTIKGSTIGLLGASYKPNVKDIQLSPIEQIIKKLEIMNAKIKIYDPYFKSQHIFSHKTEDNFLDSITNTDAVIIITAHNEFHDIDPTLFVEKMISPVIVDTRGMIDVHAAKKAGIIFRGIGRGGI